MTLLALSVVCSCFKYNVSGTGYVIRHTGLPFNCDSQKGLAHILDPYLKTALFKWPPEVGCRQMDMCEKASKYVFGNFYYEYAQKYFVVV
jgi:hypothetical protein